MVETVRQLPDSYHKIATEMTNLAGGFNHDLARRDYDTIESRINNEMTIFSRTSIEDRKQLYRTGYYLLVHFMNLRSLYDAEMIYCCDTEIEWRISDFLTRVIAEQKITAQGVARLLKEQAQNNALQAFSLYNRNLPDPVKHQLLLKSAHPILEMCIQCMPQPWNI